MAVDWELKRRAAVLQALSRRKKRAFREKFIGRRLEVLIETEIQPGLWDGLSNNYIRVLFPPSEGSRPGKLTWVKATGFRSENLEGATICSFTEHEEFHQMHLRRVLP